MGVFDIERPLRRQERLRSAVRRGTSLEWEKESEIRAGKYMCCFGLVQKPLLLEFGGRNLNWP